MIDYYYNKFNFSRHISFLYKTSQLNLFEIGSSFGLFIRIIYYSIILSNLLSNGLIIYIIVSNRKMHKVTNFFVINLALANIITNLFSTPFQVS